MQISISRLDPFRMPAAKQWKRKQSHDVATSRALSPSALHSSINRSSNPSLLILVYSITSASLCFTISLSTQKCRHARTLPWRDIRFKRNFAPNGDRRPLPRSRSFKAPLAHSLPFSPILHNHHTHRTNGLLWKVGTGALMPQLSP